LSFRHTGIIDTSLSPFVLRILTVTSNNAFKGVGVDNNTLSDPQLEQLEASFQATIACRSHGHGNGYMLFVTASNEPAPLIPGVRCLWTQIVNHLEPELC
jgi:hypothetical protein